MKMYLYDLESNGFLHETTELHCIVIYSFQTNEFKRFSSLQGDLQTGIDILANADVLIGHNVALFDNPVIKKLCNVALKAKLYDTLIIARMLHIHEHLEHSLDAWGKRLKVYKQDFGKVHGFTTCTPAMVDYCEQDVRVNLALWEHLKKHPHFPTDKQIYIETVFAKELDRMMSNGVHFDKEKAEELAVTFNKEIDEIKEEVLSICPKFVDYEEFTPKRSNRTKGWVAGETILREKVTHFNIGSRQQVARFLKEKHNWKPQKFTDTGLPKIDKDVLAEMNIPIAKRLGRFYELSTLATYLSNGPNSWLSKVKPSGKIHGRIIHAGAVTHRCTHSGPNTANIAKGGPTRKLFHAPKGWKFVGCDAAGLELRMLAHYLKQFDGGEYIDTVLNGDIHTKNQEAAGLSTRDEAKRFIYAFLYGCGGAKMGTIVAPDSPLDIQQVIGSQTIQNFLNGTPAIRMLREQVKFEAIGGWIKALDGRYLHVHSDHVALNVLLQGGGAIVMKVATNICCAKLRKEGLNARMVLHVHDEYNFICPEKEAEQVAEIAADSIRLAGEYLRMNIPMAGEAKIGINWYEVH